MDTWKKNIKNLLPASFQEQEVFLCDLAPNLDVVPVIKSSFGVQQPVRRRTILSFERCSFLADTRGFFEELFLSSHAVANDEISTFRFIEDDYLGLCFLQDCI